MIFLGIDCGTQSTKTIALDYESGGVLADAQRPHEFVPNLPEGAIEQNPGDWVAAAEATIREVLGKLGSWKTDVAGIGVSGQQHGLVVLDGRDEVVRPAKLWCDTSTKSQCTAVTVHFGGPREVIKLVGNAMLPGYTAPKILWLRENEPENWARTRTVLLPHDYLNFWLTGEKRMEYGDASGTALFDVKSRTWCEPMVRFIAEDLADRLPEPGSSLEPAGVLRPALAEAWGLKRNVLVSAGGGDNMMGALGTGNMADGIVTGSLGTSGTLYAFSDEPVIDAKGEVAAFCDGTDHWLSLVCTMNFTLVTEMMRKLFGMDFAAFDAEVSKVPPGSDGLVFLPYLTGERTPNLPNGRGVLYGLRATNFTPGHLARAAMEGVTLGLGYGLQRMRELGCDPFEIHLTGGGSNSAVWRQICADVFDTPVLGISPKEGAALGAAIHAAVTWERTFGSGADLREVVQEIISFDESMWAEPREEEVEMYRKELMRMSGLRCALAEGGYL